MNCYVKDRKTFRTLCVCPVLDYELTPWSIYDEVSTLTVSREKEELFREGDFIILGTGLYCGIIKEAEVDIYKAELKCEHIIKLLSRDLLKTEKPDSGIEQFIKNQIDEHYTNQPDMVYSVPYLNVTAATATLSDMAPEIKDGVWNIKSYTAKVRRLLNVFIEFIFTRDSLNIILRRKDDGIKQIDLSDPSVKILEESYSNKAIGKITSVCEEDEQVLDWYLLDDGTVTNTYQPNNRVYGDWIKLFIDKAEDVPFKIQDEFAKNSYSHKILFSVPQEKARFNFYDRLRIARNGRLYASYIAAIRIKKDSSRVEYQCGELRTNFTDKIQEEL